MPSTSYQYMPADTGTGSPDIETSVRTAPAEQVTKIVLITVFLGSRGRFIPCFFYMNCFNNSCIDARDPQHQPSAAALQFQVDFTGMASDNCCVPPGQHGESNAMQLYHDLNWLDSELQRSADCSNAREGPLVIEGHHLSDAPPVHSDALKPWSYLRRQQQCASVRQAPSEPHQTKRQQDIAASHSGHFRAFHPNSARSPGSPSAHSASNSARPRWKDTDTKTGSSTERKTSHKNEDGVFKLTSCTLSVYQAIRLSL